MLRSLHSFFAVLVLAVFASLPAYAQNKPQNLKVVLDLDLFRKTLSHSAEREWSEKQTAGAFVPRFDGRNC